MKPQHKQYLPTHHLLSKNFNIKIYKTTILLAVSCECETWSLKLREEHRLRVLKNRVPRIFGQERNEATESGDNYISRSFVTCTLGQVYLKQSSQGG
jgi:hypothetical protein